MHSPVRVLVRTGHDVRRARLNQQLRRLGFEPVANYSTSADLIVQDPTGPPIGGPAPTVQLGAWVDNLSDHELSQRIGLALAPEEGRRVLRDYIVGNHFYISHQERVVKLAVASVAIIEARMAYSALRTDGGEYLFASPLKRLLGVAAVSRQFVQVAREVAVNATYVRSFKREAVELVGGRRIMVERTFRRKLRGALGALSTGA